MAAANVVLTQNDLRKELAREAGFGVTASAWDTNQQDILTACLKRTARTIFQPPPLPGEPEGHSWSWLHPITSMVLWPSFSVASTRLITGAASTTITASTGTTFYQSMVGKSISFYTNVATPVFVQTSTIVSVNESAGTAVISASLAAATYQWAMTADGTYRAPVDFIGIEGPLRHAPNIGIAALTRRLEATIGEMLAACNSPSEPRFYALRPVSGFGGSAEQAWEFYVAPIPATLRTMYFAMHLNIDVLVDYPPAATTKYVPGGSPYTELWRAAGLMVVESEVYRIFDGGRKAEFYQALRTAVMHDRRHFGPESGGQYGDPGTRDSHWTDPSYATRVGTPIYYNGASI